MFIDCYFLYLGETCLHHAYVYRNLKLAAYLETCGADTMIKNNKGKTPAEVGHDYTDTRGVRGYLSGRK